MTTLDEITTETSTPYESRLHRIIKNPYVRAGATVAIAAAALPALADSTNGEPYGFFSGMWDGALLEINLIMSFLNDGSTWVRDGRGLTSAPNSLPYWIGYITTAGTEGALLGGVSQSLGDFSSKG